MGINCIWTAFPPLTCMTTMKVMLEYHFPEDREEEENQHHKNIQKSTEEPINTSQHFYNTYYLSLRCDSAPHSVHKTCTHTSFCQTYICLAFFTNDR